MLVALRRSVPVVFALLALSACGARDTSPVASPSNTAADAQGRVEVSGTLNVFAAASLTETFTELGKEFTAANPGVKIVFNFAGSSALAAQITSGAPADVFAAASPATMQTVVDGGDSVNTPQVFVRNTLEIAVPPGNPGKITGLSDFTLPERTIALCAPEVPCGAAASKVFAAANLVPQPDTLESDVKAVLTKVEFGEVDAALVYKTDVISAGDKVEGIEFPEASKAVNDYLITGLTQAPNGNAATAFVAFVLSQEGRDVLTSAGFTAP